MTSLSSDLKQLKQIVDIFQIAKSHEYFWLMRFSRKTHDSIHFQAIILTFPYTCYDIRFELWFRLVFWRDVQIVYAFFISH